MKITDKDLGPVTEQVGTLDQTQVWYQLCDEVWDQVRNQVRSQVVDKIWTQVGGQVLNVSHENY